MPTNNSNEALVQRLRQKSDETSDAALQLLHELTRTKNELEAALLGEPRALRRSIGHTYRRLVSLVPGFREWFDRRQEGEE
jgi:hypothetical protein